MLTYSKWVPYILPQAPPAEAVVAPQEDWVGPYGCIVPGHLDECIAADGCNLQYRPLGPGERPRGTKKGVVGRAPTRAQWLDEYTELVDDGRRMGAAYRVYVGRKPTTTEKVTA